MLGLETSNALIIVLPMACACVGLVCGFFIGRFYTLVNEPKRLKQDRKQTLTALVSLMASTDRLNEDVDSHNSELVDAKTSLARINEESAQTPNEYCQLQRALLSGITRVMDSNRKLEHDLVISRYKLEEQAQELDRTRIEARTDVLCEVGNRKAFDESLSFMISRGQQTGESFGLMLIDIDHFKRINDTFGHLAGDKVLTSIGQVLRECIRPEDIVSRLGGDEFAVLLEGLTDATARTVGDRIRGTIELHDFSVGEGSASTVVTMSMGLAVVNENDTPQTLFERSDNALYRSKELGRNRLITIIDEERAELQLAQEALKLSDSCQKLIASESPLEIQETVDAPANELQESNANGSYEAFKAALDD